MKLLRVILIVLAAFWMVLMVDGAEEVFGQAYSPVPFVQPQYLTSTGAVAAGYQLCTLAAGTTNPLTTYQTYTGTANTNPITLNPAGYPQNGSSTVVGIWLPSGSTYKLNLYAPGTGNTCNGTPVGALQWSIDGVPGALSSASIVGTTNQIAKFTGTNAVGSANATDNGSTFSITETFNATAASYFGGAGSPTARIHVAVGTTSANTAPIKLTTSGAALMLAPEAGSIETDGSGLYFTNNVGTRGLLAISGATTSSITGLGVSGYLPGWTSTTTVGTSTIFQTASNDYLVTSTYGGFTATDIAGSGGLIVLSAYPSAGFFGIASSAANASWLDLDYTAGFANIRSGHSGAGTTRPLRIMSDTNETARFQLDGNACIGCTADAGFKLDVNGTFRTTAITDTGLSSTAGSIVTNNGSQVLGSSGALQFNSNNELLVESSVNAPIIYAYQTNGGQESAIALGQPGSGTTQATITTNLNGIAVLNDLLFVGLNGGNFGLTTHGNYNFGSTITTTSDTNAGEWTLILKSLTAPTGNPQSGAYFLYVDPADSKLKAKGSGGTVTILGTP